MQQQLSGDESKKILFNRESELRTREDSVEINSQHNKHQLIKRKYVLIEFILIDRH